MKLALLIFTLFITGIASGQVITTIAGGATGHTGYWGDGGPATAAQLPGVFDGEFDRLGNFYFSLVTGSIQKITPDGIVYNVAGSNTFGFSGDGGPATAAQMKNSCFALDSFGNIYIADYNNCRVRKVDATSGIITTIAGNGTATHTGDGFPATAATLTPSDIGIDKHGNIYLLDSARVRKIDISGIITTIGGDGIGGFSGDGGPAISASLIGSTGICFDSTDNVFFGANGGVRIRKINVRTGIISTVAGTGNYLYNGDSIRADTAQFKCMGLAFDAIGNLFIADHGNQRIRKIDSFGIIHTIAGNGLFGFAGDGGLATVAKIAQPQGVAIDPCGNVYISDKDNNRIRKVTYPPMLTTPDIALTGAPSVPVGSATTVTATVTNAGSSYLIHWMNHGIEFTTTTVPGVTYTKPPGTDTITARVVPTGYGCWDSATSAAHIVSVDALHSHAPGASALRIYPNPAGNVLYIDALQEEGSYTIITIVGAVAKAGAVQRGGNSVSLVGMAPGIYLLQVQLLSGAKAVYKIVKE